MDVLRTPDSAFEDLEGYAFVPRYVEVDDGDGGRLRIHHVDEGSGPSVLLLHGEPSWSYLYRRVIPILVDTGFRVLAPDLVGFGRSDKPVAQTDYTYARHVGWMQRWLEVVGADRLTLFAQDWGGLIGLRLIAADPDRFAAVVVSNTGLPTGDQQMPGAFLRWREFSRTSEAFDVGRIVDGGTVTRLGDRTLDAYRAPFPDDRFLAGARIFPSLVPITPDDPEASAQHRAWEVLRAWSKPFLTAFSDSDPITAGSDRVFQSVIPGAVGVPHRTIEGAGHFLQEDNPHAVAAAVGDAVALID
jgi:haloalkane dehalogenase